MASDPFSDRNALDANPFSDPSVQGALNDPSRIYGEDDSSVYKGTGSSYRGADDLDGGASTTSRAEAARLEEIRRREAELAQRERDLEQRAAHIQKHGRNNWPFFYPLIYHDIASEIPADAQPIMLNLYRLWLLLVATLAINLVACVLLLVQGSNDGGKDMISGIVYLPVIGVASFLLWYRPVYNGFMKEHSLFYYLYFIFCGFHLAFSVYVFLGIPSTGSAGLINTIQSFTSGKILAGVFGLVATVGFAIQGLGNLWYYRLIWQHNHEQGHTFAQAKAELTTHGMKAYFTRGSQV
ncbi:scamp-domain-containing protein [Violaceomyces palustris]|uniref:Scamp-domain-containing protein n=1 Tax=Violaceomyces palustris TaxID=1673888 RepID=A0ACD0P7X7_9BASI|nr:scamp-domain-containing protein [Violaceomyces palustris]